MQRHGWMALVLGVGALACTEAGDPDPPLSDGVDVVQVGIIDDGDSEDYGRISAPTSVATGEELEVVVRTLGGGCEEPHSMDAIQRDDVVLLFPYDRTYVPPTDPNEPDVVQGCTSSLRLLEHRVLLRFDAPGEKTLRLVGRRDGLTVTYRLTEISQTVVVEQRPQA